MQSTPTPTGRPHPRVWLIPVVTVIAIALNAASTVFASQEDQAGDPTLVDPAGYAFSIWGVIFLANLVFAAYQALPGQREDRVLHRAAAPYIVGQVFAGLFAVAVLVDSPPLGQASTVLYFAAAVVTYIVLGVGARSDGWARRLGAWLAASMSGAWLLAASIVVLAGFLQNDLEVSPPVGTGAAWAAAAIGLAALVAIALLITRRDFVFAAVVAWALVAIGQEQTDEVVDAAVIAALAAIALVAIGTIPKATIPLPWSKRRRREDARTG